MAHFPWACSFLLGPLFLPAFLTPHRLLLWWSYCPSGGPIQWFWMTSVQLSWMYQHKSKESLFPQAIWYRLILLEQQILLCSMTKTESKINSAFSFSILKLFPINSLTLEDICQAFLAILLKVLLLVRMLGQVLLTQYGSTYSEKSDLKSLILPSLDI